MNGGGGALERPRIHPGALQRLPRYLQQNPLLRIHARRFPRRNPEERRIESANVIQEAAVAAVHLSRTCRICIIVFVEVPPVHRNLGYSVFSVFE
jgi:hypothetical protein